MKLILKNLSCLYFFVKSFLILKIYSTNEVKNYDNNLNINKNDSSDYRDSLDETQIYRSSEDNSIDDNRIDNISSSKELFEYACTTHTNISICMIDIVGFSQWCSKQKPIDIFKTMTKYNAFLNSKINEYEDIEKVELVGDSVLIVGGLYTNDIKMNDMVCLCYDILSNIKTLKIIFEDETISIRIGLHLGDVHSGFIRYPKKFQLFGNSINVASRLESSSLPGVLHVSTKALSVLNVKNDHLSNFNIGKTLNQKFKGVGIIVSKLYFVKVNKIHVADDVLITSKIIEHNLKKRFNIKSEIHTDVDSCFKSLKEKAYPCVILDRYFDDFDILQSLIEFRIWESKYRTEPQKIILISSIDNGDFDEGFRNFELYVDKIIDKKDNFLDTLLQNLDIYT